ncbi:MAG: DUF4242 domain-containing protein [Chloroflexi bacterium]|nr:DUF4242 domain-containing protein [Chloroflexota bacterium]
MPLFLDIHHKVAGMTAEALEEAHRRDVEVQAKYGVRYLKYWYDLATERVFCLVEAPNREAAEAVHREAHGHLAEDHRGYGGRIAPHRHIMDGVYNSCSVL